MKTLSQEQLDEAIRKAKGRNAVEKMVHEGELFQVYLLSNGMLLEVNKQTGRTVLVAGTMRRRK